MIGPTSIQTSNISEMTLIGASRVEGVFQNTPLPHNDSPNLTKTTATPAVAAATIALATESALEPTRMGISSPVNFLSSPLYNQQHLQLDSICYSLEPSYPTLYNPSNYEQSQKYNDHNPTQQLSSQLQEQQQQQQIQLDQVVQKTTKATNALRRQSAEQIPSLSRIKLPLNNNYHNAYNKMNSTASRKNTPQHANKNDENPLSNSKRIDSARNSVSQVPVDSREKNTTKAQQQVPIPSMVIIAQTERLAQDESDAEIMQQQSKERVRGVIYNLPDEIIFAKALRHFRDSHLLRVPRNVFDQHEPSKFLRIHLFLYELRSTSFWRYLQILFSYLYLMQTFLEPTTLAQLMDYSAVLSEYLYYQEVIILLFCAIDTVLALCHIRPDPNRKFRNVLMIFSRLLLLVIFLVDFTIFWFFSEEVISIRIATVLRPFWIATLQPDISKTLYTIVHSFRKVIDIFLFFVCMSSFWGYMAYNLFSDYAEQFQDDHYFVFGTIGQSILGMYTLMSMDSYPTIVKSIVMDNPVYLVFFIPYIALNLFFLLFIPVAVIFDTFKKQRAHLILKEELIVKEALTYSFYCVAYANPEDFITKDQFFQLLNAYYNSRGDRWKIDDLYETLNVDIQDQLSLQEFLDVYDVMKTSDRLYDDSYLWWNRLRSFCNKKLHFQDIGGSNAWNYMILFVVTVNTLMILLSSFLAPDETSTTTTTSSDGSTDETTTETSATTDLISNIDLAFNVIYFIDVVLKLVGFGVHSYFADTWNNFDFLMACVSLVTIVGIKYIYFLKKAKSTKLVKLAKIQKVLKIFRSIRSLKLFRILKLGADVLFGIQKLFHKVAMCVPSIFGLIKTYFVFTFSYAVIGTYLFNIDYNDYNLGSPFEENDYTDFNTVYGALLALFQVKSNWIEFLYDYGYKFNIELAVCYFGFYHMFSILFFMSLLQGMIWEVFSVVEECFKQREREQVENYLHRHLLTSKQQQKQNKLSKAATLKPSSAVDSQGNEVNSDENSHSEDDGHHNHFQKSLEHISPDHITGLQIVNNEDDEYIDDDDNEEDDGSPGGIQNKKTPPQQQQQDRRNKSRGIHEYSVSEVGKNNNRLTQSVKKVDPRRSLYLRSKGRTTNKDKDEILSSHNSQRFNQQSYFNQSPTSQKSFAIHQSLHQNRLIELNSSTERGSQIMLVGPSYNNNNNYNNSSVRFFDTHSNNQVNNLHTLVGGGIGGGYSHNNLSSYNPSYNTEQQDKQHAFNHNSILMETPRLIKLQQTTNSYETGGNFTKRNHSNRVDVFGISNFDPYSAENLLQTNGNLVSAAGQASGNATVDVADKQMNGQQKNGARENRNLNGTAGKVVGIQSSSPALNYRNQSNQDEISPDISLALLNETKRKENRKLSEINFNTEKDNKVKTDTRIGDELEDGGGHFQTSKPELKQQSLETLEIKQAVSNYQKDTIKELQIESIISFDDDEDNDDDDNQAGTSVKQTVNQNNNTNSNTENNRITQSPGNPEIVKQEEQQQQQEEEIVTTLKIPVVKTETEVESSNQDRIIISNNINEDQSTLNGMSSSPWLFQNTSHNNNKPSNFQKSQSLHYPSPPAFLSASPHLPIAPITQLIQRNCLPIYWKETVSYFQTRVASLKFESDILGDMSDLEDFIQLQDSMSLREAELRRVRILSKHAVMNVFTISKQHALERMTYLRGNPANKKYSDRLTFFNSMEATLGYTKDLSEQQQQQRSKKHSKINNNNSSHAIRVGSASVSNQSNARLFSAVRSQESSSVFVKLSTIFTYVLHMMTHARELSSTFIVEKLFLVEQSINEIIFGNYDEMHAMNHFKFVFQANSKHFVLIKYYEHLNSPAQSKRHHHLHSMQLRRRLLLASQTEMQMQVRTNSNPIVVKELVTQHAAPWLQFAASFKQEKKTYYIPDLFSATTTKRTNNTENNLNANANEIDESVLLQHLSDCIQFMRGFEFCLADLRKSFAEMYAMYVYATQSNTTSNASAAAGVTAATAAPIPSNLTTQISAAPQSLRKNFKSNPKNNNKQHFEDQSDPEFEEISSAAPPDVTTAAAAPGTTTTTTQTENNQPAVTSFISFICTRTVSGLPHLDVTALKPKPLKKSNRSTDKTDKSKIDQALKNEKNIEGQNEERSKQDSLSNIIEEQAQEQLQIYQQQQYHMLKVFYYLETFFGAHSHLLSDFIARINSDLVSPIPCYDYS